VAPNYYFLLLARVIAGGFGGVAGAVVLAIVGDVIPLERRGQAMGVIMTAFSLASIFGVPVGVALAQWQSWHTPFWTLGAASLAICFFAWKTLPVMPPHAEANTHDMWQRMAQILAHPNHQRAFMLVAVLMAASSLIYPFLSPAMVANAGLPEKLLGLIYICGGAATFFTSNYIGRLADHHGKLRVFTWTALLSALPTLAIVYLGPTHFLGVLVISTTYMIFSAGRIVPSFAMITASVDHRMRGGFMGVNSAVQHLSAAIAISGGSLLVRNDAAGHIEGYPLLGWISVGLLGAAVLLAKRLRVTDGRPPAVVATEPAIEAPL
jgi:predicted MFS family arabinose efflux permease